MQEKCNKGKFKYLEDHCIINYNKATGYLLAEIFKKPKPLQKYRNSNTSQ